MSQDRTEKPTERALRRAREAGEVAQSRDLTAAVTLIVVVAGFAISGGTIATAFSAFASACWRLAADSDVDVRRQVARALVAAGHGVLPLVPIIVAGYAAAVFTPMLQVRPLLTLKPLQPNLKRLDFVQGFKRVFGSLRTFVELGKSVSKMSVIGLIFWLFIHGALRDIVRFGLLDTEAAWTLAARLVLKIAGAALTAFVVLAIVDFVYQNWQYLRDKRMTKEEVKRERYDQYGRPEVVLARRRLRDELAQASMLSASRTASAFIANPEHLVCAIRFDPQREAAPRLVAKGSGALAARLRAIAAEENIPLTRNISLARALYELQTDELIPPTLYEAVRIVLQWVEVVLQARGQRPPWYEAERDSRAGRAD